MKGPIETTDNGPSLSIGVHFLCGLRAVYTEPPKHRSWKTLWNMLYDGQQVHIGF